MNDEITTMIKIRLNSLADLCLEHAGTHRDYADEDLMNAVMVLQEVFTAKMYDHQNSEGMNREHRQILAGEAGKSIRQTILLFTGVDLHTVLKPTDHD